VTLDLRDARTSAGLTARDVAVTLGVHPTTVHRWERHERRPAPRTVSHLAATLRADRSELLESLLPIVPLGSPASDHRGTGLRALRHETGVTVAAIATAAGVPQHTVYNWESGRARIPAHRIDVLAELFDLPADRLLTALRRPVPPRPASPLPPLHRLRTEHGWSQAALARAIGVSRTTLRDWERGVTVPPWPALRHLSHAIGVPLSVVAAAAGRRLPAELDPRRWRAGMLAGVLVTLREWSDLTQAALAGRLDCSTAAVRCWERGDHKPSPALRARLERLYRLYPGALLAAA